MADIKVCSSVPRRSKDGGDLLEYVDTKDSGINWFQTGRRTMEGRNGPKVTDKNL